MGSIICELCGGNQFIKKDGMFQCECCGTMYTPEDARALMGIVKIDRSEELNKILKNADDTYTDGNYKEAFELYSQVLSIDPENAHAALYRAMSSAWQSTVKDCRIVEFNKASERALLLKHSQVGDCSEYFNFANDALIKASKLIGAISDMYIRYYNKAKPKAFTISTAIATAGISAQVKQTMEKGISNCSIVSSNLPFFITSQCKDYSESSESVWNNMEIVIKNAMVYRNNANMCPDVGLDEQLRKIQVLRNSNVEIRKFKGLLDMGILTQEEFDKKKKDLLNL